MNRILTLYGIFILILLLLCLTGCKVERQEIENSTGYIPVKVYVEEVSHSIVMKKGVLRIRVSYLNLSSEECATTIDLGRNPKGLIKKGDTLTMYLHPEHPDKLKYVKRELHSSEKM